MDNLSDKGYLRINVRDAGDECYLCEIGFVDRPDENPFYVDYENGTIYINNGDNKNQIGYYVSCPYGAKVFDYPSNRLIGLVGEELIYFCKKSADCDAEGIIKEGKCLAWYTEAGAITPKNDILTNYGMINGSLIGGAAAFVAVFYNYSFESVFRRFFIMEDRAFCKEYTAYLD